MTAIYINAFGIVHNLFGLSGQQAEDYAEYLYQEAL